MDILEALVERGVSKRVVTFSAFLLICLSVFCLALARLPLASSWTLRILPAFLSALRRCCSRDSFLDLPDWAADAVAMMSSEQRGIWCVCVCVCGVVVKKVGPSRSELSAFCWPWRCEIFARLLRTLTGLLRRLSDSRVLRFSKNFGSKKFLPGSTKSSAAQSGRHTALTRLPPHARLTRIGNFSNVRAHLLQPLLRPATSRSRTVTVLEAHATAQRSKSDHRIEANLQPGYQVGGGIGLVAERSPWVG